MSESLIVITVAAVIAFLVTGIVLSRNTSSRKKEAIASLEQEKKAIGRYSIVDLVAEEVDDLGLQSIDGAEGIPPDVLLKAWTSTKSVHECDHSRLRYVTDPDVVPGEAQPDDVKLICEDPPSDKPQDAQTF